ncbi:MAG: acyl-CoA thioesterase [Ilumatobacter sp.]
MRFDEATAVTRVDDGRYTATVHDGWDIGGNANGGYLMAMAGRAMADTAGRSPLTLTGHYLRPAPPGPCEIETTVIKTGRRLVTVSATLTMGGKAILALLGAFGEQTPGGASWRVEEPIDLASWDDLAPGADAMPPDAPSLMDQVNIRMRQEDRGFRLGAPSGSPEMHGWFALADDEPMDVFALLLAADAYPPPLFNSGLPVAWAPTVELTVHIRGIPKPGPLRCSFRSRFIHDGMTDEEGEIWDSSGALVCQARQLALMPLPPE